MMDQLVLLGLLLLGVAIGTFWKELSYRELKAKYERLTDRDARGRFKGGK